MSDLSRRRLFTFGAAASAGLLTLSSIRSEPAPSVPSHWIALPPILCRECKMQFMVEDRTGGFEVIEYHAEGCRYA